MNSGERHIGPFEDRAKQKYVTLGIAVEPNATRMPPGKRKRSGRVAKRLAR
jgi:hypothetical protein